MNVPRTAQSLPCAILAPSREFSEELRLEGVQVLGDNGRGEYRVAESASWTTRAFFVLLSSAARLLMMKGIESWVNRNTRNRGWIR